MTDSSGDVPVVHQHQQGGINTSGRHGSACVQYERLITGQETEVGEAPPDYELVALLGM